MPRTLEPIFKSSNLQACSHIAPIDVYSLFTFLFDSTKVKARNHHFFLWHCFGINSDPAMGDAMAASLRFDASKAATLFVATTGAESDSASKKYTYGKIGC